MSLYGSFATDPVMEREGIVVVYPDPERKRPQAYRVRLRRLNGRNSLYNQAKERLMKPYRGLKLEDLPEGEREKLNRKLFCESVVVSFECKRFEDTVTVDGIAEKDGWLQGVEVRTDDGRDVVVATTPENLDKAFSASPDFLNLLFQDATDAENYKSQTRQADSKNS